MRRSFIQCALAVSLLAAAGAGAEGRWGTGALMVVIERESGSVLVVDAAQNHRVLGRVEGLGVLHHASVSFSRDARYAYVISRDGLLSKVDLLTLTLAGQAKVGESAVGLAVTQDGRHVAVSNYKPGSIVIVAADSMSIVKTIEADQSKTVGLVDAPGNRLIVSLMDANQIWIIDANSPDFPVIGKYLNVGEKPYDALLTPDGRYYIAGFFHSPWMALLDLWNPGQPRKIAIPAPKESQGGMPVLKIPHLEGWISAGDVLFAPVIGGAGLAVIDVFTWKTKQVIPLLAHPIFAMAQPDLRRIWVNFVMGDHHGAVQVVDTQSRKVVKTLNPANKIFHMQFTPKGEAVYLSSYGDDKVLVYDPNTLNLVTSFPAQKPSGIFCSSRAHVFGL
ncbi:MAG: protein nirF [Nitrospinae bacterium]|nr:protein nirF [Nitrospinota bacterium]